MRKNNTASASAASYVDIMEKNHMEKIRVTVITYEWTSGSGNSTSYITDFIFA